MRFVQAQERLYPESLVKLFISAKVLCFMGKSSSRIVLERMVGFLIFLIILGIANYVGQYVDSPTFSLILEFFNASLLFLFVITIFGLLSELFWNFMFPFNLAAPLFSGFVGLLITRFIFMLFDLIEPFVDVGISFLAVPLSWLVFCIVVAVGYIILVVRLIGGVSEKVRKVRHVKKR